jgi:hypothetical protein
MVYDNIICPFLKMEDAITTRGHGSTVVIHPGISGNLINSFYKQALSSENVNEAKCTLHFGGQYLIQSIQHYIRNSEFYSNPLIRFMRFYLTYFIKNRQLF